MMEEKPKEKNPADNVIDMTLDSESDDENSSPTTNSEGKFCNKTFKTQKSLNEHFSSTHTNVIENKVKSIEADYSKYCKICKKFFFKSSILIVHNAVNHSLIPVLHKIKEPLDTVPAFI